MSHSSPRAPAGASSSAGFSTVALGALIVLAAIYFAWPAWRALLPLEIDGNEGWNAYWADAVRLGTPLYGAGPMITNNYPPLSFVLIGALSAATSIDALTIGRALSLAATIVLAGSIWTIVRQLGGSAMAAIVGAAWYLATMARFFQDYVGMNDPHLLALAITMLGLTWFMGRMMAGRSIEPAILVMVLAGFFKHTLIATPATALLWLTMQAPARGLRAAVVGVAAAALGLAACRLIFGAAFFNDVLLPPHPDLRIALGGLGRLQWIAPALVMVVLWAVCARATAVARFVALFTSLALIAYVVQKFDGSIADNAQFELTVAVAIGLGCTFEAIAALPLAQRIGRDRSRAILLIILIARLLLSQRTAPYLLVSPEFRATLWQNAQVATAEAARVAAIPGDVACSNLLVCRKAGKPMVMDHFTALRRIAAGTLSATERDAWMRSHHVRFEHIDLRASVAGWR